ncbi:organic solute transporter Ostalpha-domain-containing protein [Flammula alnicola]|nr:organic solute transporter Ostalpha-domain-containing protein [Flammula alnicola]
MSNNTSTEQCFKVVAEASPPLFQNGKIVLQNWLDYIRIIGAYAIVTSFWLIRKHLRCYTNKREQRYIVRLLFMVPLYASISFASFLFWNHSTPIILIRDAYEAIVLTAFFYLLLMYLSHDTEEQRRIFSKVGLSVEADAIAIQKGQKVAKWDGLYFLQLMKWGVLQYCDNFGAVILNYIGLYCESSWALGWGHIYITIIMSVSVTIAMYCLIQLYVPVAKELAVHKPLLKLFSVKAVVFLTFWQATFLSLLSMFGIVKDTKYMTAEDVNNAISALLETFEMMVFAFLHIRAFTYKPYSKPSKGLYPSQTPQWRSLGHAMDFRETSERSGSGMRGKEPTPDFGVIREAHYEGAFGRQRLLRDRPRSPRQQDRKIRANDSTLPTVHIEVDREVEVEVNGQRQLGHPEREKSEGLQEQIERELERLGYPKRDHKPDVGLQPAGQRSWWRNIYNRISQSGHEPEESEKEPFTQPGCHVFALIIVTALS